MVETVLVGDQLTTEMINFGKALLLRLEKLNVPVRGQFWLFLPDQRLWRLIVASPETRIEGPRAMYRKIQTAIKKMPAGTPIVGVSDITVVDEKWPLFDVLRRTVSTGNSGVAGVRFTRNVINGHMIDDAYIYRLN